MHISSIELAEMMSEIESLLELSDEDKEIVSSVIENDTYALSVILMNEGIIRKNLQELNRVKLDFLKKYSDEDYGIFKKYNVLPLEEWDFLNEEQKAVLKILSSVYTNSINEYFEDRGDLMIYRKTINSFLSCRLVSDNPTEDLEKVRNYLMHNYSYNDSILNLGLSPSLDINGMLSLSRIK